MRRILPTVAPGALIKLPIGLPHSAVRPHSWDSLATCIDNAYASLLVNHWFMIRPSVHSCMSAPCMHTSPKLSRDTALGEPWLFAHTKGRRAQGNVTLSRNILVSLLIKPDFKPCAELGSDFGTVIGPTRLSHGKPCGSCRVNGHHVSIDDIINLHTDVTTHSFDRVTSSALIWKSETGGSKRLSDGPTNAIMLVPSSSSLFGSVQGNVKSHSHPIRPA